MNDSTQQITWSQAYQDFKEALQGAADAMKTGSEHVYEVLIRQQLVNSITYLIIYFALGATVVIAWKLCFKTYKEDDDYAPIFVIPALLSIFTCIVFIVTVTQTVTGFINPEYGAIQEIKSFIK